MSDCDDVVHFDLGGIEEARCEGCGLVVRWEWEGSSEPPTPLKCPGCGEAYATEGATVTDVDYDNGVITIE